MKIYFSILITLIFSSCANIVPPSGGAKDSQPPQLINSVEILNKQNNRVNNFKFFISLDNFIFKILRCFVNLYKFSTIS